MRAHAKEELSHYSQATSDFEYLFPIGWGELEGVAHRGDFDLTQHAKHSGKALTYFDEERNEHIVPHVIEPALGVGRVHAGVPDRQLRRGDGREGREARRAAPAPRASRRSRWRSCRCSRNEKLTPTARDVLRARCASTG